MVDYDAGGDSHSQGFRPVSRASCCRGYESPSSLVAMVALPLLSPGLLSPTDVTLALLFCFS